MTLYRTATPSTAYSTRGRDVHGSAIDSSLSVLARLEHPVISFAMGSPAPDAMPRAEILRASEWILSSPGATEALDYAPTEGLPALRSVLLDRLGRLGSPVDPDSLLVTTGGMQGIDLVCRLFVEPGDLVLAESPSYANGLATLRNHGADVRQVPLDSGGMDLVAAASMVSEEGRTPRLIYAIPTFQNPSGISYRLERRQALLDLARSFGALILEDDPYSELRYEGDPLPSLLELDEGRGSVISVSTFSKILAPGLRVGWVVAPADTIDRMISARQSMDTCTNSLSQRIVARLIETGELDTHVARLRDLYPRRRDAMLAALERQFGSIAGVRWTRPVGGMFVWVDLPTGVDGAAVLELALDNGVAVVPGSAFDGERCRHAIRLCYTGQDEAAIDEGVARLAETIEFLVAGGAAIRAAG